MKPLRERQDEIEVELNHLQQADKRFEMTLDVMLDLASKSYTLFESSRNTEKREILKLLFSNLTLSGEKLDCIYTKPFDLMVNLSEQTTWLPLISIFRTERREEIYSFIKNSYKNIQQTRLVA